MSVNRWSRCPGNRCAEEAGLEETRKEKNSMLTLKRTLLIGACTVAAAATALPMAANARSVTQVYGGGSSLIGPYMTQAFGCYGKTTPPLIVRGPPVSYTSITPFNFTGNPPQDCATTHVNTLVQQYYDSAGSGAGIANFFSHDPTSDYSKGYGDIDPNTAGEQDMPSVSYGMSDAGLSATDVGYYNNGNDDNGPNAACSTAVQEQTVCVVGPTQTANPPTTFANPKATYGAMVQFPISVDPVAVAYDSTYEKVTSGDGSTTTSYHFHIAKPHSDGSGGLHLNVSTLCKIFNGQITNWNDAALKKLNGGMSLEDPADPTPAAQWSVPLQIAGRSDSSGTTSIFTRHLANVCATTSGNQFADGSTSLPAGLIGGVYDGTTANNEQLGKFEIANGSGLVAKYVAFTAVPAAGQTLIQGHMGYDGADFVLPGSLVNGNNNYGLQSADLQNSSGAYEPATGAAALTAFGSISPPQSDAKGDYDLSTCSGPTGRCRAHPYDWVEPVSKTSPLANPSGRTAYPMVGTTNMLAYTCYANARTAKAMTGFIGWYVGSKTVQSSPNGLLIKNGLSALPSKWRVAIKQSFVSGSDNLNLNIQAAGSGTCAGVTGG
jgi:ABC-type phosphate transport system substrate-binding protein